jgi:hypothetical protein
VCPAPEPSSFLIITVPFEYAPCHHAPHHPPSPHAPSAKLITEFLRKINKVWNKREARKLALQKSAFEAQIQELRRRVNQRTPYPRVMLDHKVGPLLTPVLKPLVMPFRALSYNPV